MMYLKTNVAALELSLQFLGKENPVRINLLLSISKWSIDIFKYGINHAFSVNLEKVTI